MAARQEGEVLAEAAALALAVPGATLATLQEGAPHASLVTPGFDGDGGPVLLLSSLAAHTRHLQANAACALLVAGEPVGANPQTAPRLSMTGSARPVADLRVRERYLRRHPYAAQYADFSDFSFWKITVVRAWFIGGFANAQEIDSFALQREISVRLDAG